MSCHCCDQETYSRNGFSEIGGRWILTGIENGKKMVSTNGYFVVRERKLIQWHLCAREKSKAF